MVDTLAGMAGGALERADVTTVHGGKKRIQYPCRCTGGLCAAEVGNLKLGVAEAFVSALRAMRAVEVAKANEVSLASHAADVENMFAQGMVARNDLLAARVALADAR